MAMNNSGPISLGGATVGESINLEIGSPATSTVSLNDTTVRTLAGVATGQIIIPTDFYGKSISNAYFQVFNTPAATVSTFMSVDPSGSYYIRGPLLDIFCNSSGTITSSKAYTAQTTPGATANYYFSKLASYRSVVNPSNLIFAGNAVVSNAPTPATNSRTRGAVGVFNDSTDTFSAVNHRCNWSSPAPTPAGASMTFLAARDFPNGNIVATTASLLSGGNQAGLATFDQSLNLLSYIGLSGGYLPVSPTDSFNVGRFIPVTPSLVRVNFPTRNSPVNAGFQTVYLNESDGSVNYVNSFGVYSAGNTARCQESYSPTISYITHSNTNAPAGGNNKVRIGQFNTSPRSFNYQKEFSNSLGSVLGVNSLHSQSNTITSSNNLLLSVSYGTTPTTRPTYLINIDSTTTVSNRWTVSVNGATNDLVWPQQIILANGQYYLLGNVVGGKTHLLVIPEDLSKISSGLTVTLDGVTLILTPVSDPGALNLVPSSLSISTTSFSPLSFVQSGTPNGFTYASNIATQTKTTV